MATRPSFRQPEISRHQEQIDCLLLLHEAATKIHSILDLDELLDRFVNEICHLFGAMESSIWLRDCDANEMVLASVKGCTQTCKGQRLRIGYEGMIGYVGGTAKTRYAPDVTKDAMYSPCEPEIQSELDIPLIADGELIGVFSTSSTELDAYSESEILNLERLANTLAVAIRNTRGIKRDRSEREEARLIQQALLPRTPPSIENFEVFASTASAGVVSGDWYDFIPLDDGKMAVLLADVSGKGMPAALLMSATRSMIRAIIRHVPAPGDLLAIVNRYLRDDLPEGKFITMTIGVLDPANRKIVLASAGHPWPVLADGRTQFLQVQQGLPLGITDCVYPETEVTLESGAKLILYSDGITEAENSVGEEYGPSRLFDAASSIHTSECLLEDVFEFAGSNTLADDATVVVLRCNK